MKNDFMLEAGRRILAKLPAGAAHHLGASCLRLFGPELGPQPNAGSGSVSVMGLDFPNRIGLAAGFDKNATLLEPLFSYGGFGFIEAGSVTLLPQKGNRHLIRIRRGRTPGAVLNRCGLPSKGLLTVAENIKKFKRKHPDHIVGISIAPGSGYDDAFDPHYEISQFRRHADYAAINLSCPNTEHAVGLDYAISRAAATSGKFRQRGFPVLLKAGCYQVMQAAEKVLEHGATGMIVRNSIRGGANNDVPGWAESGPRLTNGTLRQVELVREFWAKHHYAGAIVACGGIMTGADARLALNAGADLVQTWSAFATKGRRCVAGMVAATTA